MALEHGLERNPRAPFGAILVDHTANKISCMGANDNRKVYYCMVNQSHTERRTATIYGTSSNRLLLPHDRFSRFIYLFYFITAIYNIGEAVAFAK